MESITITIDTQNAAFEGQNLPVEVARILRDLADRIERRGEVQRFLLRDINGNCVGEVEIN